MKPYIFALVLGAFFLNSSVAQNVNVQPGVNGGSFDHESAFGNNPHVLNLYNDMRIKFGRMGEEVNLTLEDIDGTIYLNENFTLGSLYEDGEEFKKLYMRYDAYNDEVELEETLGSNVVRAMVKHPIYSCAVNGNEYYYLGYTDEDGNPQKGYLTPVVTGDDYTLFVKHIKVFKEGKPAKTSLDNSFPHRFLDKTEYYVSKTGDVPMFMKTRKSDVLSMFSEEDQKAIKSYIKDKRPNVNDGDDLRNLFAYGNSL
ncbi:hypothetical protein [Muricauda sp. MAR_2010_75]|uniref:hypothetical protein n=1 Tax=Allomuricauda sp. MAR_2010_75 TaxID=1250232 RepID=UPI00056A0B2F|nr:hypothetical protein [Muricauda sp. MAR_2010_75]